MSIIKSSSLPGEAFSRIVCLIVLELAFHVLQEFWHCPDYQNLLRLIHHVMMEFRNLEVSLDQFRKQQLIQAPRMVDCLESPL